MVKPGKYKAVDCCGFLNKLETVNVTNLPGFDSQTWCPLWTFEMIISSISKKYRHMHKNTVWTNKIYFVIPFNSHFNISIYDYS